MWFKSDISVYDRDDFLEACRQAPKLPLVWEWVQRESIKQESETVIIKNNLHQTSINNRLQVTELEFQQAIVLLGELELVIYDNYKYITLPNWLLHQGTYFAEKKRKAAWIAKKRGSKKEEKKKDVESTLNLRSGDVDESRCIEEIRVEEIRVEEIINYPSKVINSPAFRENASQSSAKKIKKAVDYAYTPEFEEIWELYGREGSKKEAFSAWKTALQRASYDLVAKLKEVIPRYLRCRKVKDGFKKHLSSWLNGDCWESYWELETVETVEELEEKVENNARLREFAEQEAHLNRLRAKLEEEKAQRKEVVLWH